MFGITYSTAKLETIQLFSINSCVTLLFIVSNNNIIHHIKNYRTFKQKCTTDLLSHWINELKQKLAANKH